jgi:hypothetical protein
VNPFDVLLFGTLSKIIEVVKVIMALVRYPQPIGVDGFPISQ